MQLNEIIEENTLESISRKTRLSVENLEKLFRMDFTDFRKVQALGFISILEREYRADLSELRAACTTHFSELQNADDPHPAQDAHRNPPLKASVISDMTSEKRHAFPWKPILGLLVAVALVYGAWLTYAANRGLDTNPTAQQGGKAGFFTTIMQQAQSWLGNVTDSGSNSMEGAIAADESNQSNGAFEIAKVTTEPTAQDTANNGSVAEAVQQPTEQTSAAAAAGSESQSQNTSDTSSVTTEEMQQIGDAISAATDTQEPLATEVPSVTQGADTADEEQSVIKEATQKALQDAAEAKARQEEAARKQAEEEARRQAEEAAAQQRAAEEAARLQAEQAKAAQEQAAQEQAARAAGVTLIPRSKVWLGVVNLLTMKRRTSVSKKSITFKNPNGGKWIVATGHGRITFKMKDKEMKLNDGKKHFLLIQDGAVKEISHTAFQKLNRSKVW